MAAHIGGDSAAPPDLVIDDPDIMPQFFMMDIIQPLRFRFRLMGTDICERWQEDLTGECLMKRTTTGHERQR